MVLKALKKSKAAERSRRRREMFFKAKPRPLNERLDEMGIHYRPIYENLTRVLAIIENASTLNPPHMTLNPPHMTEAQFRTCTDCLITSMEYLSQAYPLDV
jgi:hypothetical protein